MNPAPPVWVWQRRELKDGSAAEHGYRSDGVMAWRYAEGGRSGWMAVADRWAAVECADLPAAWDRARVEQALAFVVRQPPRPQGGGR